MATGGAMTYGFSPCGFSGFDSFGCFGGSGDCDGDDDFHEEGINEENIEAVVAVQACMSRSRVQINLEAAY